MGRGPQKDLQRRRCVGEDLQSAFGEARTVRTEGWLGGELSPSWGVVAPRGLPEFGGARGHRLCRGQVGGREGVGMA